MKKQVHVTPHERGWAVKKDGADRASRVMDTQKEAIRIAREQAMRSGTELLIHGQNGKIREKNSYGNDPSSIKG